MAIANIRKTGGGYSISLTINDVIEEKSVFAEQKSCEGCNEFKVADVLKTLAGGGAAPAAEAPAAQASKGAAGNDMSGNVWEWTDSWYDDSKKSRVLRGGSWGNFGVHLRAATRNADSPGSRSSVLGFRCAQSP